MCIGGTEGTDIQGVGVSRGTEGTDIQGVCVSGELKVRIGTATEIITADMLQTVWNGLDYRVDVCRITNGAHIEHL